MLVSKFLIQKYPHLKSKQPGIEFLVRLFFLMILSWLLKQLYWLISDDNGIINISFLKGYSLLEMIRSALGDITAWLIKILGYNVYRGGWEVGIVNEAIVSIQTPCLGINVSLVFLGLVLAYPSSVSVFKKVAFATIGLIIIQSVNVLRMLAMVFVIKNRYQLPIEHHDLFNIIVYLIIFGLFYWFTTLDAPPQKK